MTKQKGGVKMAFVRLRGNKEAFLTNPRGKRSRRKSKLRKAASRKRTGRKKRNALGEIGLLIGNPRKKGGVRMAKRKSYHRKRRKSRSANPLSKAAYRPKRKHRRSRRNPLRKAAYRRHHRRRNPVIGGVDVTQIIFGAAAAMVTTAIPTWIKAQTPTYKYGSQLITAVAGKYVVDKLLKVGYGSTWLVVSLSMIAADLLKEYVLSKVTLLTASGPVQVPAGTSVTASQAIPATGGVSGYIPLGGRNLGAYLSKLPSDFAFGSPFAMH